MGLHLGSYLHVLRKMCISKKIQMVMIKKNHKSKFVSCPPYGGFLLRLPHVLQLPHLSLGSTLTASRHASQSKIQGVPRVVDDWWKGSKGIHLIWSLCIQRCLPLHFQANLTSFFFINPHSKLSGVIFKKVCFQKLCRKKQELPTKPAVFVPLPPTA